MATPHPFGGDNVIDLPRRVASNQPLHVAPQYKAAAVMRRSSPFVSPNAPLNAAAQAALDAIRHPAKLQNADSVTHRLVLRPGPALQAAIDGDPSLESAHLDAVAHVQRMIGVKPTPKPVKYVPPANAYVGAPPAVQKMAQIHAAVYNGAKISPADMQKFQAAAFAAFPQHSNFLDTMVGNLGKELVGVGPGLVHLGVGLYNDPTATLKAMGVQIYHSYGELINHPLRLLKNDPLGFISDVAIPLAAAGAVARVGDLGAVGSSLRAGEITKAQAAVQVVKILHRAQNLERDANGNLVRAQRNVVSNGVTLHPPLAKGAFGYVQRKALDPISNKLASASVSPVEGMKIPSPLTPLKFARNKKTGREALREMNFQADTRGARRAADEGIPLREAVAQERQKAMADRQKELFEGGINPDEYAQLPASQQDSLIAVRKPKPASKQASPSAFASNPGFKAQHDNMFEHDNELVAQNSDKFSYVSKSFANSSAPYAPGTGALARAVDVGDKATQLVRSGRLMTPSYSKWAVQNAGLVTSQQGALVFRSIYDLKKEVPKLSAPDRAEFDAGAGVGKGVTSTLEGVGEGFKPNGRIRKATDALAHGKGAWPGWSAINDDWARRMSLIHELNSAGYHGAEAWSSLMRDDPERFRSIARTAQREVIDYREMTPTERATFGKLTTAYGWTRGATTYTARYPFNHPAQATIAAAAGKQGKDISEEYFNALGGSVPSWMRSYLPIGGGFLSGDTLSPAGTMGGLFSGFPGVHTGGSLEALDSPVVKQTLLLSQNADKYGKPGYSIPAALGSLASAFRPYKDIQQLKGQGPKSFVQGPLATAENWYGFEKLADPHKTAISGEIEQLNADTPAQAIIDRTVRDRTNVMMAIAKKPSLAGPQLQAKIDQLFAIRVALSSAVSKLPSGSTQLDKLAAVLEAAAPYGISRRHSEEILADIGKLPADQQEKVAKSYTSRVTDNLYARPLGIVMKRTGVTSTPTPLP